MIDLSYTAALSGLIKSGLSVAQAAEVVSDIRGSQPQYWEKAIQKVTETQEWHLWILVGRYSDVKNRVTGHAYCGRNPSELLKIRYEDDDVEYHAALFDVGPDVKRAFKRLLPTPTE